LHESCLIVLLATCNGAPQSHVLQSTTTVVAELGWQRQVVHARCLPATIGEPSALSKGAINNDGRSIVLHTVFFQASTHANQHISESLQTAPAVFSFRPGALS